MQQQQQQQQQQQRQRGEVSLQYVWLDDPAGGRATLPHIMEKTAFSRRRRVFARKRESDRRRQPPPKHSNISIDE
jgi:hypothetical protein